MGFFDFFKGKRKDDDIPVREINSDVTSLDNNIDNHEEDENEYTVILKNPGSNKIAVIKVIREITGLGLVEAKTMVDEAPQTLKKYVSKYEAEEIKVRLAKLGAEIEIY